MRSCSDTRARSSRSLLQTRLPQRLHDVLALRASGPDLRLQILPASARLFEVPERRRLVAEKMVHLVCIALLKHFHLTEVYLDLRKLLAQPLGLPRLVGRVCERARDLGALLGNIGR